MDISSDKEEPRRPRRPAARRRARAAVLSSSSEGDSGSSCGDSDSSESEASDSGGAQPAPARPRPRPRLRPRPRTSGAASQASQASLARQQPAPPATPPAISTAGAGAAAAEAPASGAGHAPQRSPHPPPSAPTAGGAAAAPPHPGTAAAVAAPPPSVRVESVRIENFKSFRDAVLINLSAKFTAVVGPNGAGKSTVVDAIAFAFGSRASAAAALPSLLNDALREEHGRGAAGRGGAAPCGSVEVVLVDRSGARMALRRQLQLQGSGRARSSYTLRREGAGEGEQRCSSDEHKAFLLQRGVDVGTSSRFLMYQSQTTALMRQGPAALQSFLEDVVGTRGLHEEIAAIREREAALVESHEGAAATIECIATDRRNLAPMCEKLERHEGQFAQLAQAWILFHRCQAALCDHDAKELEETLATRKSLHAARAEELRQASAELDQAQAQVSDAQAATKASKNTRDAADSSHSASTVTLKKKLLHLRTARTAVSTNSSREATGKATASALSSQVEELHATCKTLEGFVKASEHIIQQAESSESNDVKLLRQQTSELTARLQNLDARASEGIALISRVTSGQASIQAGTKALDALKQSQEAQLLERERFSTAQREAQSTTEQLRQQRTFADGEQANAKQAVVRLRQSRPSMFGNTVAALVQEDEDIYGTLAMLATCNDAAYLQALASVLRGKLSKTIVTKTHAAAVTVIARFKKDKIGVVTAIIVAESSMPEQATAPRWAGGQAISLLETISCESRFMPVFGGLLATWFVAPSMEAAAALSFDNSSGKAVRRNVVTLDGELFRAGGLISGGAKRNSSGTLDLFSLRSSDDGCTLASSMDIKSADESQREATKAGKRLQTADALVQTLARAFGAADLKFRQAEENFLEAQQLASDLRGRIAKAEKKHGDDSRRVQSALRACERLKTHVDRFAEVKSKKQDIQARLLGLLGASDGASDQPSKLSENKTLLTQAKKDSRVAAAQLQAANKQVKSAEKKRVAAEVRVEAISHEIADIDSELPNQAASAAAAKSAMDEQIATLSAERQRCKKIRAKTSKLQSQADTASNEIRQISHLLASRRLEVRRSEAEVKKRRAHLLKPAEDDSQLMATEEDSLTPRLEEFMESISTKEGRAEADAKLMDHRAVLSHQERKCSELFKAIDVEVLERDLKLQIDEEQAVKSRNDADSTLEQHRMSREALERRRLALFVGGMEKIAAACCSIYQRLNHRGSALLTYPLGEESLSMDDGVHMHCKEITASASGLAGAYQWKSVMSMSGGQQALASLALTLAINEAYPSPFLFIDEIDASLDVRATSSVADEITRTVAENQTQVVAVTHRPQMYEQSNLLVSLGAAMVIELLLVCCSDAFGVRSGSTRATAGRQRAHAPGASLTSLISRLAQRCYTCFFV